MADLETWYEFRQLMADALAADLIGGPSDVTLTEPPLDRFAVGILHPRSSEPLDEAFDEQENAEAKGVGDAAWDPAVALSHMRYPSTAGLTFAVDVGMAPEIVVEVTAARYREAQNGGPSDSTTAGAWERVGVAP